MSTFPQISTQPKTIEGTWEEIMQHAPELVGHRLKVEVFPLAHDLAVVFPTLPAPTDAWVMDLYEWAFNRRPVGPADDSRDAIYNDFSP